MVDSAASTPRNCAHEALPFVEASAKVKLAGSIETQPGDHFAALSAFCIIDVRRSESFQCTLKAGRPHDCSFEHIGC
jgi:hypothetical protein